MLKWPYADMGYLSVEHWRSIPHKDDPAQTWEYLTIQAVFVSDHAVLFFDEYAKEYKRQRAELDEFLERLGVDGWKLTTSINKLNASVYQFRQYHFRREIK